MITIRPWHKHGISVNKGVVVDARLVKSTSKPISNEKIEKLIQELDNNGNIKKFARNHESPYFPRAIIHSMHTDKKIKNGFGDKGYDGLSNRAFLAMNNINDGIMRKDHFNARLTDLEIQRNKAISKFRYIVEQYFGISHLHDSGDKERFPKMVTNIIEIMFRQFAFNLTKGTKYLKCFLYSWIGVPGHQNPGKKPHLEIKSNWVTADFLSKRLQFEL